MVEHDAEEIWQAVLGTLTELTTSLDQPIAAIGITDQRETVVLWDKRTGVPRPRRSSGRTAELLPAVSNSSPMAISIWSAAPPVSFSIPTSRARSSSGCSRRGVENDEHLAFGTIDSWLVWKLTGGVHITDTTNASRTLLFDIRNMRWSDEMCALFNVPMSALPEVRPSSGRFGVTTADLPIPSGVPVSGIAGDQQAALFGQACFAPGQAKNTYGTGSFVLMNVGETCPAPVEGLLTTVAWTLDSGGDWKTTFAYEGAIFVTGAAIQWLRDGLQIIDDAGDRSAGRIHR